MAKEASSWSILAFVTSLAAGNMLACSAKTVDLGGNNQLPSGLTYSTGVPTAPTNAVSGGDSTVSRIVAGEPTVSGMYATTLSPYAVDSGRLYWLSSFQTGSTQQYSLRSCAVDHCADSLMTHGTTQFTQSLGVTDPVETPMQVDGSDIYWRTLQESVFPSQIATSSKTPNSGISAVDFPWAVTADFVVKSGTIYACMQDVVVRCRASNCKPTSERFAMTPPAGESPLAFSHMLGQDDGFLYLTGGNTITIDWTLLRVPKDPNASYEILSPISPTSLGGFALYGDNMYWTEYEGAGRVLSCPKTGCMGAPKILMTGLNGPTSLAVDDDTIYVIEPPQVSMLMAISGSPTEVVLPGRVLKCPITGCAEPAVLYAGSDERLMTQLVVDDRFVYFYGSNCHIDFSSGSVDPWAPCAFIAAIPK